MVLWIGVDDTDTLQGMCTTFLLTEIVRDLTEELDLIGYPRLVRLNPNIPWKTRGNAALCARFGRGQGPPRQVGEVDGRPIFAFRRSRLTPNPSVARERVAALVERWACFEDHTTNPGFVVLRAPAPPWLYWSAVRKVVTKRQALRAAARLGHVAGYKNGRGIIGALASTAWRPQDRTYEILAYRRPSRWGTPRDIDPASVVDMDRRFPSTFNNYDYENRRVVIAPHSPCPILFGIRGDNPEVLPDAMRAIRSESRDRWLVFETNQGTDDHVSHTRLPAVGRTIRMSATVSAFPRVVRGGHVVVRAGIMDLVAYEPSKQFRTVVGSLIPGDRIMAVGSVRNRPRSLNLEKLKILSTVPLVRKEANPWCSTCGKRAKSIGKGGGFRCVRCGARFRADQADWRVVQRNVGPGWYEPPVSARRHLSKPLKRQIAPSPSHRGNLFPDQLDAQARHPEPLLEKL
jgi:tRNA(Ile2)-agmatinylcytidine synthase